MRMRDAIIAVAQPRSQSAVGMVYFGGSVMAPGSVPTENATGVGIWGVTTWGNCVFGRASELQAPDLRAKWGRARWGHSTFV